ncbi:MAG TPA: PD-(D/E)XK nuclease family protein [Pyrinomonadaceae bacterium]|nr:PD-(D/E)XK nuclease family protein [Pyrinomonadaceae bacterium]
MQSVEAVFRKRHQLLVALDHARNKKERLPKIPSPASNSILSQWHKLDQVPGIEERLTAFNIFSAINATDYEVRHSNFLAWLLDPDGAHGFGSVFLKTFLDAAAGRRGHPVDNFTMESWLSGATIEREAYGRIDIVVLNTSAKFVCIIENKVHSGEHSDQLRRYRQAVEQQFPEYTRLFVFLSLRPEIPSDPHYGSITYAELAMSLKGCVRDCDDRLPSVRFLFDQYFQFVTGYKTGTNVFSALQLREIKHSDFHSWLFNPRETHNLGTSALKEFIRAASETNPSRGISRVLELDLSDVEIKREEYNIDLLLVSERAKVVIAIENKLDTREGKDQLKRYKAIVKEWYPGFEHHFIFFTLRGDQPTDPEYLQLKFGDYARALLRLVPQDATSSWQSHDVVSVLIADYFRLIHHRLELRLKTRIELAPGLSQVCSELFQKEKTVVCGMLSLVRQWQEGVRDEMEDFVSDLILHAFPKSYRSPVRRPQYRAFKAFVPPQVDHILPVKSDAPKRLFDLMFLSFPFTNRFQNAEALGVSIICTIRRAEPKYDRLGDRMYEIAQLSPELFNLANRGNIGARGNARILSHVLVTRDDFLFLSLEEVKHKLEEKLLRFKTHQYPRILEMLKSAVAADKDAVP